jgi:DNA-binding transcriptional MerR regulator
MKIKKFAEMTNLTPRTIRFYEEKGIFKSQRHPINDYRIYTEENVEIAKRISHFRNLGFSIADISSMLKDSPNLSVEQLTDKVARNLEKLQNEMTDLELKIKESEDLLKTAKKNALMNEKQKQLLINADSLMSWMTKYVQERLHKKVIGQDEELQIVACAYADLMLKVAGTGGFSDFGKAHQMIEKCR